MTALQPVWTPADYDATLAAAALHEPVAVGRHRVIPNGTTDVLPTISATRGRSYRGEHRANRFRQTVADLVGAR